ncbi:hypothetical protein [Nonomuraea sp. NPDC046570]|uniref:hypothetical protein n=1 Tax=Nonomuraea sp. NPDC046570 TaxID=3155255 RepID=UPI0033E303F6
MDGFDEHLFAGVQGGDAEDAVGEAALAFVEVADRGAQSVFEFVAHEVGEFGPVAPEGFHVFQPIMWVSG